MNRFQKGLLSSSWEFSITLKFPEISVGIKIKLFGTAGNFPGKVIHLQRWLSPAGTFRPKLTVLQKFLLPTLLVLRWEKKSFGWNVTGTRSSGRRHCLNQTMMFLFLLVGSSGALSIQQKIRFEISEISRAQWSCTFRLHRPDPSQRAYGYCFVNRMQKSGTGDNNFVKWKGTFGSDRRKRRDRLKWTTFKAGPEYSGRTKPKWSVPFYVPTEISGIWGWMESAPGFWSVSTCRLQDRFHVTSQKF